MTTQRDGTNAPAGEGPPTTNQPDGQRRAPGSGGQRSMPPARSWLWFALILLANFLLVRFLFPGPEAPVEIPYPPKGEGGSESGSTPSRTSKTFTTVLPSFVIPDPGLEKFLIANGVKITAEPIQQGGGLWQTLLFAFGPALLLIGGYIW